MGGQNILYTRSEGHQNKPIPYVREGGVTGGLTTQDGCSLTGTKCPPDGTIARDWGVR